jgi:hypothetical protein
MLLLLLLLLLLHELDVITPQTGLVGPNLDGPFAVGVCFKRNTPPVEHGASLNAWAETFLARLTRPGPYSAHHLQNVFSNTDLSLIEPFSMASTWTQRMSVFSTLRLKQWMCFM